VKPESKIIILDRDGVINHDSDKFIKSPDEWIPIEGSLEAIGELTKAGYSIFVLTNQSGIAREYFSLDTLSDIHQKMTTLVESHGGAISDIFFCPHGPDDNCDCRKPLSGMYQQLQAKYPEIADFNGVPSIGDSIRDLQAACSAGASPVLVKSGKGLKSERLLTENNLEATVVFDSLADYANQLLN